jgi:hypothetical protein
MSTLWTPDGERPVSADERAQAEALAKEMAEVRDELARTPAAVIVANHVMGFYELAAIHLSQQPPNFPEATVAIDAMRAVVEKLPGRLGENEQVLRDALSQLQLAFVQLKERAESVAEAADDAGIDIDPAVEDPVTEDPVTDD